VPKSISHCVVLYVEDNEATVYLFQMALRASGSMPQVFRVRDGGHAVAYLTNAPPYEDAPVPDLVVLDLNLPGDYDGMEILSLILGTPRISSVPVYIFSSSGDPKHRAAAMALGAQDFITKGDSLDHFIEAAKAICSGLG
jgi:chemotaxis family two-component system response regulator Rcp1